MGPVVHLIMIKLACASLDVAGRASSSRAQVKSAAGAKLACVAHLLRANTWPSSQLTKAPPTPRTNGDRRSTDSILQAEHSSLSPYLVRINHQIIASEAPRTRMLHRRAQPTCKVNYSPGQVALISDIDLMFSARELRCHTAESEWQRLCIDSSSSPVEPVRVRCWT